MSATKEDQKNAAVTNFNWKKAIVFGAGIAATGYAVYHSFFSEEAQEQEERDKLAEFMQECLLSKLPPHSQCFADFFQEFPVQSICKAFYVAMQRTWESGINYDYYLRHGGRCGNTNMYYATILDEPVHVLQVGNDMEYTNIHTFVCNIMQDAFNRFLSADTSSLINSLHAIGDYQCYSSGRHNQTLNFAKALDALGDCLCDSQ